MSGNTVSTRDYFAGLAMQSLIKEGRSHTTVAQDAYKLAEAMMQVRKKVAQEKAS